MWNPPCNILLPHTSIDFRFPKVVWTMIFTTLDPRTHSRGKNSLTTSSGMESVHSHDNVNFQARQDVS